MHVVTRQGHRLLQLPDSNMNEMYSSMPYSMIQYEFAQPMRDDVTM